MLRSLVGSEMCIRDSPCASLTPGTSTLPTTTKSDAHRANSHFSFYWASWLMSSYFLGSPLYWCFYILLWSSLGRKMRFIESSPTPYGIGALPPVTKREIEPHCVGVPKFIMCGSRNSGRQSVVSQENYNFLTNNMNKLLEEEKADKIREQFEETLPFDTETLFLVLVVGVILAILSAGCLLYTSPSPRDS